ncbi:MAG TPA: cytochrome c [Candidatus Acidoferrum sp.]|nr:cytochrome c [Candidatus Acidoferrum sp.]
MRRNAILWGTALLLGLGIGFARQKDNAQAPEAAQPPASADDAAKKNPVKPTPEGLAEAKRLYGYHCAMCHGKDGDGKGDLAVSMDLKLHDWRDPTTIEKMTDGELFYIITNGRGKMVGGEGDRTKEQTRWNLVNLVRSFGKKSGT